VRLQTKSINAFVSDELRTRIESELIQNALDAYKARARLIADQLGFTLFRIVDLHVSTGSQMPRAQQARYAHALIADAVAAPAFEAGSSTLEVTVTAKVELR
jgi:predicted secreted protein